MTGRLVFVVFCEKLLMGLTILARGNSFDAVEDLVKMVGIAETSGRSHFFDGGIGLRQMVLGSFDPETCDFTGYTFSECLLESSLKSSPVGGDAAHHIRHVNVAVTVLCYEVQCPGNNGVIAGIDIGGLPVNDV